MIKSLELKNFRSYKNEKIVFHKRINAIIGDGLAGKSNILRAIEFIRKFRPINKKHLSWFAPKGTPSELKMNFDDGNSVYLKKGEKESCYKTFHKGEELNTYRKLNKNVPLEVENFINLKEINFQKQLDSPYIISDSPGIVTKIINDITRVSAVDCWIKRINQDISGYNILLNDSENEYVKVCEKLKHIDEVKKVEPILKRLKKIELEEKRIEDRMYDIESTIAEINISKKKIKYFENALNAEGEIEKIKKIESEISGFEKELDLLTQFINAKEKIKRLKEKSKKKIETLISTLKKLKVCPTCLHEIDNRTIRRIKNEVNRDF